MILNCYCTIDPVIYSLLCIYYNIVNSFWMLNECLSYHKTGCFQFLFVPCTFLQPLESNLTYCYIFVIFMKEQKCFNVLKSVKCQNIFWYVNGCRVWMGDWCVEIGQKTVLLVMSLMFWQQWKQSFVKNILICCQQ